MVQIVVIDDNPASRATVEQNLRAQGYDVATAASLKEVQGWNGGSAQTAGKTLRELERKAIEGALEANHGNRTHAARQLGISLRKLQYRLKEYNRAEPV